MKSGAIVGGGETMGDVLNPPQNPWLLAISSGKVPLPRGVRLLRNSSEESAALDRHARIRAATIKCATSWISNDHG
jgi:hypothetical protein